MARGESDGTAPGDCVARRGYASGVEAAVPDRAAGGRTDAAPGALAAAGRVVSNSVTAAVGAHYRTVQRWVADYRQGGVVAVIARHKGGHGHPRRLTADQEAALAVEASRGRFRTATEARQWLSAQYGVAYTEGGMYSVLARLRLHPKVPRPVNPKANVAVQQAWKRGRSRPPSRQPA